ncbi:TetR/AcrR family transcriptional regulator [Pseudonocardia sp. EV170527-09]|uniref:TetR/AcrR family transcriptional regulator n=1 Tax=Pseudonocardia sp. EV170527-09 TaxID=2603411 RepID=UPI0011F3FC60|nr:TetR/AcrR family transcriptional regulator [Pseudonocardia sp. EV170527-09]KAA1021471.1 TetR/AcrR family transcriptional regulator [Pseudonocardia sp. EV170527-09]
MARERATDTTALVAAAGEAFRRKGYRNATIDDIAEAAGISRPTVYKYTRSKQHLLDLMVEEVTADLRRRLELVLESGEPPETRLRGMISAHIEAASANRTFYAIVFSEEVELSEQGRASFRAWAHDRTQDFRLLLDECLPAGGGIDTTIAANLVMSMLATLYRWYDPSGAVSPEELGRQIEKLLGALFPSR